MVNSQPSDEYRRQNGGCYGVFEKRLRGIRDGRGVMPDAALEVMAVAQYLVPRVRSAACLL
jgi:hypothetical protein